LADLYEEEEKDDEKVAEVKQQDSKKSEEAVNIILYPSQDEVATDQDSDEEEGEMSKDPNHLGKGILSQQAELENFDEELPEEEDEEEEDEEEDEEDNGPGQAKKLDR
jgi:hypothetical protein